MDLTTSAYDICAEYDHFGFTVWENNNRVKILPAAKEFLESQCCVENEYGLVQEGLHPEGPHKLTYLTCRSCGKYLYIWLCGQWCPVQSLLVSNNSETNGVVQVKLPVDHIVAFILSQICYNQHEIHEEHNESPFIPFSQQDVVKIFWKDGVAVGFYSTKPKGSWFFEGILYFHTMVMFDTVYIRQPYRRQGLSQQILDDLVFSFPNEHLGFSDPLSDGFQKAILAYLKKNERFRDLFWICGSDGDEGERENLWLMLRMKELMK